MFSNRAAARTVQERIRCGFGRLNLAVVQTDDPNYYGWQFEHDDPFSPIIISQNSEMTVCSGITMDEALMHPQEEIHAMDEVAEEESDGDQNNHSALAVDHEAITTPHNIQSESPKQVPIIDCTCPEEQERGQDVDVTKEANLRVKSTRTESTLLESCDLEQDCLDRWPATSKEEEADVFSPTRSLSSKRIVSVKLEDFDFDHLTIFEDSVFGNDEESCEDSESWIIRKLERNAAELYWLQLTTEIADPNRLILAMQGNTAVRNVTVYPSALRGLPLLDQKSLVNSICQLESLQNLIVFKDCGSLFVDPLTRHRPPLTRLTLYNLDFEGDLLLSRLAVLLLGLPELEELSLEKYRGTDGSKLLKIIAKVLPGMSFLKSLSLTPARGVRMSSEGPRSLFKALWDNNTLRMLSLQGSEDSIDQGCMDELRHSLRANTTLEEVKLTGFWKSEEDFWKRFNRKATTQIQYLLKLNGAGIRSLQLDVNAGYETLRNAICRHRENTDYIFYLLLHNPSMVNGRKAAWI